MPRKGPDALARYRSLLQKAVRRGNDRLVVTTCALLESFGPREKGWVRDRAAVITFEECWPLGGFLVFNKRFHSKVAALVRAARSVKAKDATGLGLLAHRLTEGAKSVLDGSVEDRHLRIVAEAIERPEDFWGWAKISAAEAGQASAALVDRSRHFRNAGMPRDRAIIQAGAYLALRAPIPSIRPTECREKSFPYWVALDGHTPEGRRVLKDIARDLHIHLSQLEWVNYYFDGAAAGDALPSYWWDRYCRWRFDQVGIPPEEAHLLWDPVRPQVIEALAEDSSLLHRDIYRWKMAHLDRIEFLTQQVDLFLEHFDEMTPDQLEIFGGEDGE